MSRKGDDEIAPRLIPRYHRFILSALLVHVEQSGNGYGPDRSAKRWRKWVPLRVRGISCHICEPWGQAGLPMRAATRASKSSTAKGFATTSASSASTSKARRRTNDVDARCQKDSHAPSPAVDEGRKGTENGPDLGCFEAPPDFASSIKITGEPLDSRRLQQEPGHRRNKGDSPVPEE